MKFLKKKYFKRLLFIIGIFFILGNIIAYNHAYRFTHFIDSTTKKTKKAEDLGFGEKLNTLLFGVKMPKPLNNKTPDKPFEVVNLISHEKIEAWHIKVEKSKGTILLFHGYGSCKSSLLPYSNEFNQKGYSTFLVDFMGSGGSEGRQTTVGYKESKDVKVAFEFIKAQQDGGEVILFGSSMGAAAILKAVAEYDLAADKIIIECPFATMLQTTKNRFEAMNIPAFPLAHLLLFYGGIQNDYSAFHHNPIDYAKQVKINTLLLSGAKDARVKRFEIDDIYKSLAGEKQLIILENSGHEMYLNDDSVRWNQAIDSFLLN